MEQPADQSGRLAELASAVEAAHAGSFVPVLVTGQAGSGKTRLGDEVCRRAEAMGMTVLWSSCDGGGQAPAFWPWMQMLRQYMRLHEATAYPAGVGKQMDEVIELAPWVAEIVDGRSVPELIDPATARFRLFDAVSQVLLRVAREEPLLVLLDDLEAADEHSLALLRHLAGSLNSGPIALVAMARPPGRRTSAALRETFDGLTRARGGRRLEMPPGPLAAPTGPAEGLSRRELEVASLVSGGLSNREIGEQLFISERTAENHVQSILNKLGYSSRAQVAAWVARKGFEYRD